MGDRRSEGSALTHLGLAYAALGDAHKAIEFYEKQLIIVWEIGYRCAKAMRSRIWTWPVRIWGKLHWRRNFGTKP